ncbi:MAG TPA: phosphatase PAP2 family protein [Gemmatimonadaceae bacterium]|nr:phosphatase PAP2 family protein [Gemmatimonadaceae bacterium]
MTAPGHPGMLWRLRARLRPWHRQRWFMIVAGYSFALLTGMAVARWLDGTGDWQKGLPWERDYLGSMRGLLPRAFDGPLLAISWLGTNITLLPVSLVVIAWLILGQRRYHEAVYIAVVQAGSNSLNPALKFLYGRNRPDIIPRRGWFDWDAYPSGHAIASVAVLMTLAVVLYRVKGWRWPTYTGLPILALSLFSRTYLGVHWPTDVIGGALVGLVWLGFTFFAFREDGRRSGGLTGFRDNGLSGFPDDNPTTQQPVKPTP